MIQIEAPHGSVTRRMGHARRLAGEMYSLLKRVTDRPVMLAALDLLKGKVRARLMEEDEAFGGTDAFATLTDA